MQFCKMLNLNFGQSFADFYKSIPWKKKENNVPKLFRAENRE